MSDDIFLVKYDPDWVRQFDEEAFRLREVLSSSLLVRIDHFGSTAIPGLTAKPIIDILVGVNSLEEARTEAVSPLESIGYAFWSHNPDPDHFFFAKGLPPAPHRTHHVHMVRTESPFYERLLFRDYLRDHPDEAQRYSALKQDLAARFSQDREAYTQAKSDFIAEIMQKAKP